MIGGQFAAKLAGYFDRYLEVGKIEKTFEVLQDRVLMMKKITIVSPSKLTVFLKERVCSTLYDLSGKVDLFLEAHISPSSATIKKEESTA